MRTFVVDASVAAKWCLPEKDEPLVFQARCLLEAYSRAEIGLIVPDLFWSELGNVLWKAVRMGRLSSSDAHSALEFLQGLKIPTYLCSDFLAEALHVALFYGRTFYDSLYAALAEHSSVELVTADERLANALAAHLPVKWLGAM
ncbi:MAG: type II toxin-antitoxin system VapC family toxin [Terriglobales bacterium]